MAFGGRIKRDYADILFARVIKARAGHRCEACGETSALECAHVVPRWHKGVRWDEENAFCLCHRCHVYFTGLPLEWIEWCRAKLGARYDALRAKVRIIVKHSKADKADICRNLASRLAELCGEPEPTFRTPRPRRRSAAKPRAIQGRGFDKSLKRKVNGVTERRA
jgi:hypothetical protein